MLKISAEILGRYSPYIRGLMVITIKKGKGKLFNMPTKGKSLDKQGKIWKNNLLDADLTSGQSVIRKLK